MKTVIILMLILFTSCGISRLPDSEAPINKVTVVINCDGEIQTFENVNVINTESGFIMFTKNLKPYMFSCDYEIVDGVKN